MSDLICPYCGFSYDHDGDFEGLRSGNSELQEVCPECDKYYRVFVEFYPVFSDTYKVDCWNDKKCNYIKQDYSHHSDESIARYKCSYCGDNKWLKKDE